MFHKTKSNKIIQLLSIKTLLVLVLVPILGFTLHKEYYSLTTIDYDKKEETVQISMQLFTNDMDLALSKYFEQTLELGTEYENTKANSLLNTYLKQHFSISINGDETSYHFLGKEFEKDVMFVFLEIIQVRDIKQISIKNTVLTQTYFEQENIIKLNINGQNKSLILTIANDKGMLNF